MSSSSIIRSKTPRFAVDQAADLPEDRLLLAGGRAERRAVDHALALREDAQSGLGHDLEGVVLNLLDVGVARNEDVGDGELVVESEVRRVPVVADLLGPDRARDVDLDAAAVTLAVDVAGAVEHLLEGVESERHRLRAEGLPSLRIDA